MLSTIFEKVITTALIIATGSSGSDVRPKPVPVPQNHTVTAPVPSRTTGAPVSLESVQNIDGKKVIRRTRTYKMGRLAGSKATNLYSMYLGHTGVIPKRLTINWNKQLEKLWVRKTRISKTTVVRKTGDTLVVEYLTQDPGLMSLRTYQRIANKEAKLTYTNLDWDTVGKFYFRDPKTKGVDGRRLKLLKRVSKSIRGRTLTAYMMTELLPGSGARGHAYLDFMLRHGGRRYVESIPAQYDTLTSFGPFQFTSHAVYDVGNTGKMGGASRVNRALPQSLRIPGSVSMLRGDHHLRAGYLFAVSNLAVFIKRLDARHLATFERVAGSREMDIAQFIATAHNKPEVAYRAGRRWLESKTLASYRDACPEISRLYADKTSKNFHSLRDQT